MVYSRYQLDDIKCIRCNDKTVKAKISESADVFGYNSQKPREDAYIKKDKS